MAVRQFVITVPDDSEEFSAALAAIPWQVLIPLIFQLLKLLFPNIPFGVEEVKEKDAAA